MTHPNFNLNDMVMCGGRKAKVVRVNALGLKKANCIVIEFEDDQTQKLIVGNDCESLQLCEH